MWQFVAGIIDDHQPQHIDAGLAEQIRRIDRAEHAIMHRSAHHIASRLRHTVSRRAAQCELIKSKVGCLGCAAHLNLTGKDLTRHRRDNLRIGIRTRRRR